MASRSALDTEWLPAWLEAPVWRFALTAGVCGPDAAVRDRGSQRSSRAVDRDPVAAQPTGGKLGLGRGGRQGAAAVDGVQVAPEEARGQVARIVGPGDEVTPGQIPFTPRAKKVLELALREALSLGDNYIGTEHLLLGLARENEGVAARILLGVDVDADRIRSEVISTLGGERAREVGFGPGRWPLSSRPPRPLPIPRRASAPAPRSPWEALAPPLWAGFGLAIGILLGWLIWG